MKMSSSDEATIWDSWVDNPVSSIFAASLQEDGPPEEPKPEPEPEPPPGPILDGDDGKP